MPVRSRPLTAPRASPCLRFALAGLVALWLLTQALGQIHAVLHARPSALPGTSAGTNAGVDTSASAAAPGPSVAALSRAFHPQGDPARSDDGLCRLYAQLAQGDLAAGMAAPVPADGAFAAPAGTAVASADAAPRRGWQARGPPAFG